MPGQFERHARSKWEWGMPGARSQEVQAAAADDPEPPKRGKGKKDTRRWCRGKAGTEHVLVWIPGGWRAPVPCQWTYQYAYREHGFTTRWWCRHEVRCSVCKKVLRSSVPAEECPDYPGSPEQKAQAEREGAEAEARFGQRRAGRRKVITGPQGYRRKREAR